MKTPEEILREMRQEFRTNMDGEAIVGVKRIRGWADALEEAMREPVAEYTALPDGLEWRFRPQIFDPPVGTKLYCLPPDAEEEIRYLRSRLADATKANDLFQTATDAEIERLREALEDACLTFSQYGEQPPQKWLTALAKKEDKP